MKDEIDCPMCVFTNSDYCWHQPGEYELAVALGEAFKVPDDDPRMPAWVAFAEDSEAIICEQPGTSFDVHVLKDDPSYMAAFVVNNHMWVIFHDIEGHGDLRRATSDFASLANS